MMGPMGSTSRRLPTPRHGVVGAVVGALACAVALAGCTRSPDEAPEPPDQAPLQIELVTGVSGLSREQRQQLQRQVGDVLSDYVVGAFLGDYPRDDFVDALASFTSRAAEQAAGDLDLLTARRYGDADEVVAERLVARVSAFPAEGEAAGATARVRFRFVARDGQGDPRAFEVAGRLGLLPDDDEWRIFAYEVTRQELPSDVGGDE